MTLIGHFALFGDENGEPGIRLLPEMFTADAVAITDGMAVWDSDLELVVIDLAFRPPHAECGEWWFYTRAQGSGPAELCSESRCSVAHPFTGESAREAGRDL